MQNKTWITPMGAKNIASGVYRTHLASDYAPGEKDYPALMRTEYAKKELNEKVIHNKF